MPILTFFTKKWYSQELVKERQWVQMLIPMCSVAAQCFPGRAGSWSRGITFISKNTSKCVLSTGNLRRPMLIETCGWSWIRWKCERQEGKKIRESTRIDEFDHTDREKIQECIFFWCPSGDTPFMFGTKLNENKDEGFYFWEKSVLLTLSSFVKPFHNAYANKLASMAVFHKPCV